MYKQCHFNNHLVNLKSSQKSDVVQIKHIIPKIRNKKRFTSKIYEIRIDSDFLINL